MPSVHLGYCQARQRRHIHAREQAERQLGMLNEDKDAKTADLEKKLARPEPLVSRARGTGKDAEGAQGPPGRERDEAKPGAVCDGQVRRA
jgi:hypothetical protein